MTQLDTHEAAPHGGRDVPMGDRTSDLRSSDLRSRDPRDDEEWVAGLIDAGTSLDDAPVLTRALVIPMMVTTAAMFDFTSAVASSSITVSRTLADKVIRVVGLTA